MKITNAMKKHDLKTLDQIYASDFVFVNGRGKKFNRSERMENLKTTPAPEEFAFSNEKIRVHGNVAIVNGEVNVRTKGVAPVHDYVTLIFLNRMGNGMRSVHKEPMFTEIFTHACFLLLSMMRSQIISSRKPSAKVG